MGGLDDILGALRGGSGGLDDVLGGVLGGRGGGGSSAMGALLPVLSGLLASGGLDAFDKPAKAGAKHQSVPGRAQTSPLKVSQEPGLPVS